MQPYYAKESPVPTIIKQFTNYSNLKVPNERGSERTESGLGSDLCVNESDDKTRSHSSPSKYNSLNSNESKTEKTKTSENDNKPTFLHSLSLRNSKRFNKLIKFRKRTFSLNESGRPNHAASESGTLTRRMSSHSISDIYSQDVPDSDRVVRKDVRSDSGAASLSESSTDYEPDS